MEQKKQLLIKVLTKLQPYWNLAEGIIILLHKNTLEISVIDDLILLVACAIKKNKKIKNSNTFVQSLEKIKKIQGEESLGQEDVEHILDSIE